MADRGDDRGGALLVRHVLLAGGIRGQTVLRGFHDSSWGPGVLRRAGGSFDRLHSVCAGKEGSLVEVGGCTGTEHRAGACIWTDWLSDERLLLRSRLQPAMGHPFSQRTAELPERGASDPDI